jgi:hypothetical protein
MRPITPSPTGLRRRDKGQLSATPAPKDQLIDAVHADKLEEWMDQSNGKVRADVCHDKLTGARLHRLGAHHPPGGSGGQEGVHGRAAPGVPALGARAGHVVPVRLGRRPRSWPG